MRAAAVDVLLAALVLLAWLGCAGFARLRSPFDRLHCVAFVNAGCGAALVAAALVADGWSDRVLKTVLLAAAALLAGAAISHAAGRALVLRGSASAGQAAGPAEER